MKFTNDVIGNHCKKADKLGLTNNRMVAYHNRNCPCLSGGICDCPEDEIVIVDLGVSHGDAAPQKLKIGVN